MKVDVQKQRLIRSIEQIDRIEAVVYAALGIKKCSYFFRPKEMCDDEGINWERFRNILSMLSLDLKKSYIQVSGWPSYEYFDRHYRDRTCRCASDADGVRLDIPKCCSKAYAYAEDTIMRAMLEDYPFEGCCSLDQIEVTTDKKAEEDWWKRFNEHCNKYKKDYCSQNSIVSGQIRKLISVGRLPEQIVLMTSMFVPCEPGCEHFLQMADMMHEALKTYLSPDRYDEIMREYLSGKRTI